MEGFFPSFTNAQSNWLPGVSNDIYMYNVHVCKPKVRENKYVDCQIDWDLI